MFLWLMAACGERAPEGFVGSWSWVVDRSWAAPQTDVTEPEAALEEEDYQPTNGPTYAVVITDDEVTIGEVPIVGARGPDVDARVHFDLTAGTFAGGRFEVWEDGGLQAELTLYGSGRPIASSERGALVAEEAAP